MARTCLVVLPHRDGTPLDARLEPLVLSLEREGHAVDLAVAETRPPSNGLAAEVLRLWADSSAEILVALDADRPYAFDDVHRLVRQVENDPEHIALASRFGSHGAPMGAPPAPFRLLGRVQRLLSGSRDPAGGLVAMSGLMFEKSRPLLAPIGRQVALECLLKCRGRTVDVPVASAAWPPMRRPHLDDLRQSKRLLNLRFGTWSRLVQFCCVGASGMVVDLSVFAMLSDVLLPQTALTGRAIDIAGRPLELIWIVSAALAILLALSWNFTLNRRLTFSDRREGSMPAQFLTYLFSNALAVTLSFLLRLGLPLQFAFFRDHRLVAAVVGIVAATAVSFTLARALVFRSRPTLGHDSRAIDPAAAIETR